MASQVKREAPSGISVLISGSGVGGLTAALELWRRGCDVRILERNKKNATQGDSFNIGPTATNAFRNWPWLERKNEEIAYQPMIAYHDATGKRLSGPHSLDSAISANLVGEKRPKSLNRHSRPKFHVMLLEQLAAIGLNVEYGKQVVSYFEDAHSGLGGLELADGTKLTADLVVAADGLRGQSWRLIMGHPVPARSSGDAVWRVAYPVEIALADPVIAERFKLHEDGSSITELWNGPDMHAVFWRNEDEMQWAIIRPDAGTAEESWSHHVHPDEVLKYTSAIPDWPEAANRVIKATPPQQLVDWKLMWRDPQPNWVSPAGHVVQLGDAAHTFLPSSGNGGTQAIEDSVSLATCISLAGRKENIPDALRVHNLIRFERVSCLQAFGIKNRDARNTKKNKGDNSKAHISFGKWILDHDPEEYAKEKYNEALEHLKHGAPFKNTNTPPGMLYRPWTIDGLMAAQERGEPTILDGDWS